MAYRILYYNMLGDRIPRIMFWGAGGGGVAAGRAFFNT